MAKNRQDVQLSPHFRLSEFSTKTGALPPVEAVDALRTLCVVVLEPLRLLFGVCTVTSGYRTAAHNAAVNGAKGSKHLYAADPHVPAADVKFRRGRPTAWAAEAKVILRGTGGVGTYSTHLHVDMRRNPARWTE